MTFLSSSGMLSSGTAQALVQIEVGAKDGYDPPALCPHMKPVHLVYVWSCVQGNADVLLLDLSLSQR